MVATRCGEVSLVIAPDDDGEIKVMLVGCEYTFESRLNALTAFRLGQALVRLSRKLGLPDGLDDPFV